MKYCNLSDIRVFKDLGFVAQLRLPLFRRVQRPTPRASCPLLHNSVGHTINRRERERGRAQ